jgi:inner membrane protein
MILEYWHWLILGLVLMAAEMLLPGAFFLWIGAASICVGGIIYIFADLSTTVQLVLFGIMGPLFAVLGRRFMLSQKAIEVPNLLNRRGQQLIGQILTLDAPIVNGHAHITVGGSKWLVKGPDLPEKTQVQIVDVDGTLLIVSPIEKKIK